MYEINEAMLEEARQRKRELQQQGGASAGVLTAASTDLLSAEAAAGKLESPAYEAAHFTSGMMIGASGRNKRTSFTVPRRAMIATNETETRTIKVKERNSFKRIRPPEAIPLYQTREKR